MARTAQILRLCAVGAAVALLWAASSAAVQAATLLALDLQALVAASDRIVVATAQSRSSRPDRYSRYLVTDVVLWVEENLAGDGREGERLVVTRLGGQVDGLALQVPGAAGFELGERYVVFLRREPRRGEWRTVAMSQGVLPIDRDMVLPGGAGMNLVQPDSLGELRPAPAALMHPEPIETLKSRIRALLGDGHGR